MPVRLAELAVRFGCKLRGDPDALVERVASLQEAGPGSIAFLANRRYRRYLAQTRATAVVIEPALANECPVAALATSNPYATYARIAQLLHPVPAFEPGRHPSAVVEPGTSVDATAWVGAHAFVARGAEIGPGAFIGPGSIVMAGARVGESSRLVARVTICEGVRIGRRCVLHPGAVVGGDGFGHAPDGGAYVKVPQIGAVVIGDDVEVGSNSTIDRGAIGDTVIADGVKIDNQVQIGHNVRIGEHTVIAGCVGISGSAVIGRRCMLGGMVGVVGHLEICDDVLVTGRTMISSSIRQPGIYSSALAADEAKRFRRNAARFQKLDELAKRVRRLEGAGDAPEQEEDDD
ncbi:MAG: UDP-3-O-[3-hydroxymyristoyl] glucosamine N-acyltransferase [Pseudomonadota bacterium]|nr:UDP-3-O-[3-hydroxymyristoyl] glucosamine N-acyltransferase [Pseudomonadota bacterium]MDQ1308897.1 UDP-3-O-[3-hydroxymyristoyl] glucosamine N-acyltransferase [Pseudomonadota bacterium]